VIDMNFAARAGSSAANDDTRFSAMNADTPSAGPSGVVRRVIRPVTIATQMITANIASEGAGSTRTTANARNASATAHS
jgi:hypothetical protein